MRRSLALTLVIILVSNSIANAADLSYRVFNRHLSLGQVGVHVVTPLNMTPRVKIFTGAYTCQVGCTDGSYTETTCYSGQSCCGNSSTCQAWCHNGDASGCGTSP